jgi:dihydroxyacetone kinase-like protein
MKKLINDPQNVVRESLAGVALVHPDILKVCFDPTYLIRADAPTLGKVGVVSGGGSGHEPNARFIGGVPPGISLAARKFLFWAAHTRGAATA